MTGVLIFLWVAKGKSYKMYLGREVGGIKSKWPTGDGACGPGYEVRSLSIFGAVEGFGVGCADFLAYRGVIAIDP